MSQQDVELQFREKLDMSSVFMRQLERTNISATQLDPSVYEGNVRRLMDLLPIFYRAKVWEQSEGYNTVIQDFEYEQAGGHDIGSPSNPVCFAEKNGEIVEVPVRRDEDGNVDWSDPNIYSPKLVEREITDYEELLKVILQEAENAGLTWSTEKTAKAIKIVPDKTRYRTPYLPQLEKYLRQLSRLKNLENDEKRVLKELEEFTDRMEEKYGEQLPDS